MRAKRQPAAVMAAIASLIVGAVFLRFLRGGGVARTRHQIANAATVAAPRDDARPDTADPQSLRVLLKRIEDNFATGYQTMTAIIQGVALVILVTTSAHAVFGRAATSQVVTAASQAVAVLVIIIITTDQFFQLATATRWLPTTVDTAVPYLIGVGEAVAALSLGDNTRWWSSISWSMLAGVIAFGHSAARATPQGFEGIEDYYRRFVRDVRRSRDICLALCAYAVVLAVTSTLAHLSPWLYAAAPWVITAAAIIRIRQLRWGGVPAGDM